MPRQDLEERERNLYAAQGRNEITAQGLQRDLKYREEKIRDCEKKVRQLEQNISEEIQQKERARLSLQVRRVLGANVVDCDSLVNEQAVRNEQLLRYFTVI